MSASDSAIPQQSPPMPRCPHCKKDLIGLHLVQMTLPNPATNGTTGMTFSLACCPNSECRAVLPAAYAGEVQIESAENALRQPGRIYKPS